MDLLTVTKDMAVRCILFGACYVPKIGKPISEIPVNDLIWSEKMFNPQEIKAFGVPLWALSSSGYGDGDGYSDGYGYGYGSGSGSGDGYGDGSGSGDGSGDGDGKDIGAKILALEKRI